MGLEFNSCYGYLTLLRFVHLRRVLDLHLHSCRFPTYFPSSSLFSSSIMHDFWLFTAPSLLSLVYIVSAHEARD